MSNETPSPANAAPETPDAEIQAHAEAIHAAPEPAVRIAELEAEMARLRDQAMRAVAEAENARKRAQREAEERVRYANADVARDLLPVADNLRRALDAVPPAARAEDARIGRFAEGVELTERELMTVFERYGVKRVNEAGVPFDHNVHQAVVQVDSEQPAGTVVAVFQPGYTLHGRLLRAAMVSVSKGAATAPGANIDTQA